MKNATPEQIFEVAKKYHQEGRLENAELLYKSVLTVKPNLAEAWHLLGMVFYAKGNYIDALEHLKKAIELDKNNADYHNNIGEIYRMHGMLDEAELHFKFSIRLKPSNSDAYSNLALVCKSRGNLDEAKLNFSRSLQCNPKNVNTLLNVGSLFQSQGEYGDALECYIAVMGIQPENHHALRGAAYCFSEQGEYNTAAGMLSKLTAGKQEMYREKVDLALLTLRNKDFRKGFQLFENRLKHLPVILEGEEKTLWRGTNLKGKTLYVYYEKQGLSGFGDSIMFTRMLFELEKFEPNKVIFKVQPELVELFAANMPPYVEVTAETCTEFDTHSPLLSLPLLLNLRAKSMPLADGYIKADGDRFAHLFDKNVKNIGIALQTSKAHTKHERRSITQEAFKAVNGAKLFYISTEAPEDGLGEHITDLRPHIGSFKDTADIIACLDRVITPDTSLVHLAGAMGKETALLIDRLNDWRWFTPKEAQATVWYSSVKTFIREDGMSWEDVVSKIKI